MHILSPLRFRSTPLASPWTRYWMCVVLLISALHVSARNCDAYEKELEEYFLAHQTEDRLNISRIESVYKACSDPTDKMELIFHYFQAIHAVNSTSYHDYRTYEVATYHYDESARFFPFLIQIGPEEDTFVETYFAKAFELEQWLQREARRLRYSPENRYYGESDGPLWAKSNSSHTRQPGQARGSAPDEMEFKRKFLQSGRYIDELPPMIETEAGYEAFGIVGQIDQLNMMEYIDWQRADVTREAGATDLAVLRLDPAAWIVTLDATPGAYLPVMSVKDGLAIRQNPSRDAEIITQANFGEVLARVNKQMPVITDEVTFLPVITELGQSGWIEQHATVEKGKLAVCIVNTPGYLQINARTDRNAVLFFAGELMVLEGARDNWIRVVGRNARKRGWISGPEILSIDPIDLHIGELMFDALQQPVSSDRRRGLEAIRRTPGYAESKLSPYVERLINQYGS